LCEQGSLTQGPLAQGALPQVAILGRPAFLTDSVTHELATIVDFIRYAASRFSEAGLTFGHSHDNPIDEATHLVLASLHLPPDISPVYGAGRMTMAEREKVLALIERRVVERLPVAYLVGSTWFAGLKFKSDARALVPRSPIAELIENGFTPWLDGRHVERALDLCTGSGCIGIAMAEYNPDWQVDIVDISDDALALAGENILFQHVEGRVHALKSDLFDGVANERYDLIVSNPPYVTDDEYAAMPAEYSHEPVLGLTSGHDGLDITFRILDEAADHLTDDGLLIVEVGDSEHALGALLPQVPFVWLEFKVGQMGIFALERRDLVEHADAIRSVRLSRA
jgi:ribosomal protein L3 glutamine methyltransferase